MLRILIYHAWSRKEETKRKHATPQTIPLAPPTPKKEEGKKGIILLGLVILCLNLELYIFINLCFPKIEGIEVHK